jgi:hypothetical protein
MKKQFDAVDAGLSVLMAMSGFLVTETAQFTLFGIDFNQVLWSSGGTGGMEVTLAYAIGLGALVATVVTNDNTSISSLKSDAENLDTLYYGAIVATFGLMVLWVVLPDVASFFKSDDIWSVAYVLITALGQGAIGWML